MEKYALQVSRLWEQTNVAKEASIEDTESSIPSLTSVLEMHNRLDWKAIGVVVKAVSESAPF